MKKGTFYFCIKDFLDYNRNNFEKVFILVAEYTNFNLEDLKQYNGEIFGGIVPFVIYNNEYFNKGIIVCPLEENSDFLFVEDLNNLRVNPSFFENKKSFLVLLDGLSPNITNFLENLFEVVSQDAQIIGGGAGKITLKNEPVIFTKDNIYINAAIIIASTMTLHTKISNGWEYLEGPFIATNSHRNILKALNFRKSFDVYKEVVEKDSGKIFTDDNFFDIAKSYPLGIIKFDNRIITRDPLFIYENENMFLGGDVPQNSTVNILKGEVTSLIKSSKESIKELLEESNYIENQDVVIFNCITRSIFLKDDFTKELDEIKNHMKPNSVLFGALTLGEIANNTNEYISFYNKSCIVGVFC
uniref:FIST C-terminal domain-containing protein n=1 Tax=Aliarcobacter sp. TaxID=2321116 RepID=UPI0040479DB8